MKVLTGKNILLISPEAWGISKLSKHHYAKALVEAGNNVWFLQPPGNQNRQLEKDDMGHLHLVVDQYRFPGARFIPGFIRKKIFKSIICRMKNELRTHFDVIWNFDNSRFFDLDCFENALLIHHQMDYHANAENEKICRSADICLGVTAEIVREMNQYNPHCFFVHHGYAQVQKSDAELPTTSKKIKALYVGNMLIPFINWNWMHALIRVQPEVQFYFAGSYGAGNLNKEVNQNSLSEVQILGENNNVTLLGERTTADITAFIQQSDILFAAYDAHRFPESVANSHKIMEYLGSGKPVICNVTGEFQRNSDLLYMANTLEEFLEKFEYAKLNMTLVSNEDITEKRKAFAIANKYTAHLEYIDSLLTTLKK